MSKIGELVVKIGADASALKKGLADSSTQLETFGKKMETMSGKMKTMGATMSTAITLPIIGAIGASFKLASDYNESLNKVQVAFGDNSDQVTAWSQNTLKQFGLAKGTALDMAAGFGDMATSMGLNTQQAADMSTNLVGLAGDLASFKNIGFDEANTALTSIFTGETESLKKLGVVMTEQNINEWLASKGIKKKIGQMSQAEQVQARYNYVMEKTQNAQGDFARTQGGAANQTRIFWESLKELGQTFGEQILPVITPIIEKLNGLIQKFGKLSPTTKNLILIFAGIVAVVGPVLLILGTLAGAVSAISAALPILGGVFAALAGPVGIAIAIIAALIVIGVLLYKNWDKIKAFGVSMWDAIKIQWNNSAVILKNAMREAGQGIIEIWGKIKGAILDAVASAIEFVGATDKAAAVQYEADMAKYKSLGTYGKQGGRGEQNKKLFGYASGTTSARPGLAWVGERGPELVNFRGGEPVFNNRNSMAMMNPTITHTGTIKVEGVNSMSHLVGVTEIIASELAKDVRRWPSKTAALPSRA